jgi:hypothetical protein
LEGDEEIALLLPWLTSLLRGPFFLKIPLGMAV